MESRLREAVRAGVAWLPFGHQRLCTLDNVPHTVDEALFLRRQDELIVHLERKVTSLNLLFHLVQDREAAVAKYTAQRTRQEFCSEVSKLQLPTHLNHQLHHSNAFRSVALNCSCGVR